MNTCYNPFSLANKTILVTGASSGIGRATAIECSKMGARMIITGRNEDRLNDVLASLEGDGHVAITADLTAEEDMNRLLASIDKIDGVVLCAGISIVAPIQYCARKKFLSIFETNLFANTELIRLLLKKKKLKKDASVVAISSTSAFFKSYGNAMYGAGKAALSQWMKFAAHELAPKGYRFNCISPGMTITPLISGGAISDEQLQEDAKNYIHGRYGKPEEIAYGAIYLLSDAANWITGTNLVIDGGLTL